MTSYFSTFQTGFSNLVDEELRKLLVDVRINLLIDGLVIYATRTSVDEIKAIKFFNNSFLLLKRYDDVTEGSLYKMIKTAINDTSIFEQIKNMPSPKNTKFRIRATVHNQFVAIDKIVLKKLEEQVILSNPNFIIDRSLPAIEIVISIRSEGVALIGLQLTKRPNYEKTLKKGELYPELAYILCLLSEPNNDDVFLDPFAGHGSIPLQRLNFPYKQIMAGEIDQNLQNILIHRVGEKVAVMPWNALSLKAVHNNSIDKIVTDPPWGLFDAAIDLQDFYNRMMIEMFRILKKEGILVVLTAQKDIFEELISKYNEKLFLEKKYSTLVSGKKASVYKIKKISSL